MFAELLRATSTPPNSAGEINLDECVSRTRDYDRTLMEDCVITRQIERYKLFLLLTIDLRGAVVA